MQLCCLIKTVVGDDRGRAVDKRWRILQMVREFFYAPRFFCVGLAVGVLHGVDAQYVVV